MLTGPLHMDRHTGLFEASAVSAYFSVVYASCRLDTRQPIMILVAEAKVLHVAHY